MRVHVEIARKPTKPVLLWDGACRFCAFWARRWRARAEGRAAFPPYQKARARFPELPERALVASVHLVEPDGSVWCGAEAVFRLLAWLSGRSWAVRLYERAPWFAALSEWAYGFVTRHRAFFGAATRLALGRDPEPSTYAIAGWLFPKALGLVGAMAVVSLWVQVHGLIGDRGLMPARELVEAAQPSGFFNLPTLFWWMRGDLALHGVCAGALACAVLLIAGVAPGPAAFGLWFLYLSVALVGRDFLAFQWDGLLLETSLIAGFYARWGLAWRLRDAPEPPRLARWLLWLLLFKLLLLSGLVKLNGYGPGDASAWRDFTALDYHNWTQPIPAWTSWYLQQLPRWMNRVALVVLWTVEMALPFFALGPRRARRLAFAGTWLLMGMIMLAGNYGFLNLLAMALALPLLDDQSMPRFLRRRLRGPAPARAPRAARVALHLGLVPLAALALSVGLFQLAGALEDSRRPSASLAWLREGGGRFLRGPVEWAERLRSVNSYGLFSVMPTTRPEIILSGRCEGGAWEEAVFRYKPGAPERRPPHCIPHMPRLDWLMWFAALELDAAGKSAAAQLRSSPRLEWLRRFLVATGRREPAVLRLVEAGPFRQGAPRQFRVELYHYTFTGFSTRDSTRRWWDRVPVKEATVEGRLDLD